MAKKAEGKSDNGTILSNGIVVDGKVVTGKKHNLSAQEQGQLARGEIDESGEPTGKEVKKDDVKTLRTSETLYQGDLSAEGINVVTGEEVSYKWHQAMPTTEDGCFNAVNFAFGGNIRRSSFKLDTENKIDPTKRTALELP